MKATTSILFIIIWVAAPGIARCSELIINGGFESGYTGWTVDGVIQQNGRSGPYASRSGLYIGAGNAAGGTYYATAYEDNPAVLSVSQSFLVAPNSQVIVSFDFYADNFGAPYGPLFIGPLALGSHFATADLLTGMASPLSTAPGDVLENFYSGADADCFNYGSSPGCHVWTHYIFDVSNLVSSGGTFQVRFAVASDYVNFPMGVDDVSVMETPLASTPEPSMFGITLAALFSGAILMRRRILPDRRFGHGSGLATDKGAGLPSTFAGSLSSTREPSGS